MLLRSLETVKLRMEAAALGTRKVAEFLRDHPKVNRVRYLGFLEEGTRDGDVFKAQSSSAGSTFAFDLESEAAAFRMLNALQVMKLAVSLGGTETLICHRVPPPTAASIRDCASARASRTVWCASRSVSRTPTI